MNDAILGIDIGGTKTAIVLVTPGGDVVSRNEFLTRPERTFEDYFFELSESIGTSLRDHKCYNIPAISVSIGGPLDVFKGIIKSPPNLPTWKEVPIKAILQQKFNLPVYVEHDGNAGALAEYFFGAGRGARSIVFLTLGTGFGAGLILDGHLYRGASFTAGELGHIRVSDHGPYAYGKKGSLEGYCSGSGLKKLSAMMFPCRWRDGASVKVLADLANNGDEDAIEVFRESGRYLGRAFAIIADMVNPEKIILGSLGFRLGSLIIRPAMEEFEREALAESFSVCQVVPAALGERIGDLAAICAALDQGGLAVPGLDN